MSQFESGDSGGSSPCEEKQWVEILARYGVPDWKRSVIELLFTVVPFLGGAVPASMDDHALLL